jgi:hypothetical protein
VQLSETEFTSHTVGLPLLVETFDAFADGSHPSPLTIANGSFLGEPSIGAPWCINSKCLSIGFNGGAFQGFPAGTAFWSSRVIPASSGDTIAVSVVGNGGTQEFILPAIDWSPEGTFVGFHDPQGIQSVSFRLVSGNVNYSLDDVTTAGVVAAQANAVPGLSLPGLLILALAVLAVALPEGLRRRF